ncbi:hypothetical protein ACF3OE_02715 [Capnocytophaga canis]|uniref:hypothetical protein n=1 Tax=Capnocytophaga canis TaxID=1848903 RepID=UPI00370D223C
MKPKLPPQGRRISGEFHFKDVGTSLKINSRILRRAEFVSNADRNHRKTLKIKI